MGGSPIHRSHPNGIAEAEADRYAMPRPSDAVGLGGAARERRAQRLRSIVKMKLPSGLRIAPSLCVSGPSGAAMSSRPGKIVMDIDLRSQFSFRQQTSSKFLWV